MEIHDKKQPRIFFYRTGLFFCLLTVVLSSLFLSCEKPKKEVHRIVIWTSSPEMAQYCELFNITHTDDKATVIYKENPALSLPPANDELPPDIIIGSWLRSDELQKYFKNLNYLFERKNLDTSIFYQNLLEAGKNKRNQYLLPVNFNLPAIIFSEEYENLITDNYTLTPEKIREIASGFNQTKKDGSFSRIGFIPSAEENFLYTMVKLYNVNFREENKSILYNKENLDQTAAYLKDWITTENSSVQKEQDFAFKYLFMQDYRQITSGKTLFDTTTSDSIFNILRDPSLKIDYRWISNDEMIPIEDNLFMLGIYTGAKNQPGASEFITWFFNSQTQEELLARKINLNLNTEIFGIAGGFSSLKEVTEHILPIFYTPMLTNLPPADKLTIPNKLPARWDSYKTAVIQQYLKNIIMLPEPAEGEEAPEVPSIEELQEIWQKKVFDN